MPLMNIHCLAPFSFIYFCCVNEAVILSAVHFIQGVILLAWYLRKIIIWKFRSLHAGVSDFQNPHFLRVYISILSTCKLSSVFYTNINERLGVLIVHS